VSINGIPALGFGTFGRTDDAGQKAIETALEVGYRHIDTAQSYDTEGECGRALIASGLPRGDVFVTTKIGTENLAAGKLVPSLRASLDNLQMDKVDITLIHWPSPNEEIALPVYIEQIAEAHALGLTGMIGVSNFTIDLLKQARDILGDLNISNNQIELHPFLQNVKLADYCEANGIAVTCYRPIAEGRVNDDPMITGIAQRHGATAAQVTLAYFMQMGRIVIPTSSKAERITENYGALKVTLTKEDMVAMAGCDRNERYIAPDWGPNWD